MSGYKKYDTKNHPLVAMLENFWIWNSHVVEWNNPPLTRASPPPPRPPLPALRKMKVEQENRQRALGKAPRVSHQSARRQIRRTNALILKMICLQDYKSMASCRHTQAGGVLWIGLPLHMSALNVHTTNDKPCQIVSERPRHALWTHFGFDSSELHVNSFFRRLDTECTLDRKIL